MYDPGRGWSLSFVGSGFLVFYHVGVTHCLSERAPHLLRDARMFFASSSGTLHCATFLAGIPLDRILQILVDIIQNVRKRNFGVLHPSFNMSKYLREELHKHLPANVHQLVSGKMCISLTRMSDGKNLLVSDFQSKMEVVDVLVCACFVPFYCGLIPPTFRGVQYLDGGLTDNVPFTDAQTTITVSPFYGEHDICPKVKSMNSLHVNISKLSLCICSENVSLLFKAAFPPEVKVLGKICLQGYLDALRFLEKQGICTRPGPSLNLPSEERKSKVIAPCEENMSQEAPWEAAALEMWPEGDELLETLCPKLLIALSEAMKDADGHMSKMWNFFPLRIMSYMVLPFMPLRESVVALVQRLVTWFPDIPEGIQCLLWVTCQIYSHMVACLLPTSRCRSPAPGHQPFTQKPEHD
ncbi:1-acylglycerol-3-phosphate O-acyltransferase PNPLA3-like isoform X1 [Choloepus didactylus]|uniref:1-acylglycerol-3-phosphate O-acyltransferase PNPLA3-like isoform X1 n=1 Tax=Choloepus didactylus TaxID=27675 RepID=UPI0018A06271|nr:1-acylglycerol-3-phosphate O-acyltransferase PNPLA3-like isoform X1 [Choloepus didactylus]